MAKNKNQNEQKPKLLDEFIKFCLHPRRYLYKRKLEKRLQTDPELLAQTLDGEEIVMPPTVFSIILKGFWNIISYLFRRPRRLLHFGFWIWGLWFFWNLGIFPFFSPMGTNLTTNDLNASASWNQSYSTMLYSNISYSNITYRNGTTYSYRVTYNNTNETLANIFTEVPFSSNIFLFGCAIAIAIPIFYFIYFIFRGTGML